jgi:hypothetical protein
VVDGRGRRQVLFFAPEENYRMPLELLEQVLVAAKEAVAVQMGES